MGRTDFADMTSEQMETEIKNPAAVQQLVDFLKLVQGKTGDVYSRSNAYRFSQELMELHPIHYLFHEDDVVYIGADKYEISAFDENAVSLRNVEFPLFGKEYSRADFEEKLKEKDYSKAADEIDRLREERQDILMREADRDGRRQRIEEMKAFLQEQADTPLEYDEQLVRRLVEKVTVYESKAVVEFKSGLETDVEL